MNIYLKNLKTGKWEYFEKCLKFELARRGIKISHGAYIDDGVKIGNFVYIGVGAYIASGSILEDYTRVN